MLLILFLDSMDKDSYIYKSGDAFAPEYVKKFLDTYLYGSADTLVYANIWSLVHMLSGVLTRLLTKDARVALLVHTLWECWQLYIGMTRPNLRGFIDILSDTLYFFIGYAVRTG